MDVQNSRVKRFNIFTTYGKRYSVLESCCGQNSTSQNGTYQPTPLRKFQWLRSTPAKLHQWCNYSVSTTRWHRQSTETEQQSKATIAHGKFKTSIALWKRPDIGFTTKLWKCSRHHSVQKTLGQKFDKIFSQQFCNTGFGVSIFWVTTFFNRRCLTVPVHRRPARSWPQIAAIWKSGHTAENAPKPYFFTRNTQNYLIGFRGAETFWEHHSSWRPVQRRLDSAIGDALKLIRWMAPWDCALVLWKPKLPVKRRRQFWTKCV